MDDGEQWTGFPWQQLIQTNQKMEQKMEQIFQCKSKKMILSSSLFFTRQSFEYFKKPSTTVATETGSVDD